MEIDDYFFYLAAFIFYFLYIQRLKNGLELSMTNVTVIMNFIFVILPAYFNYRGGVYYAEGAQINFTDYFLFLYQGCVIPLMAWVAGNGEKRSFRQISTVGVNKNRFLLIFTTIIIYNVLYVVYYNKSLPILTLGEEYLTSASARAALTHGFDAENEPFLFRYYRLFTKDCLFLICFGYYLSISTKRRLLKLGVLSFLGFSLLMHNEKAYGLMLLFAIAADYSNFKIRNPAVIIGYIIFGYIASVSLIYFFFAQTLDGAIGYVPIRLAAQVGYSSTQLFVSENLHGYWYEYLQLGVVGKFLGIEYIDISKMTFDYVHPNFAQEGIAGSSAGSAVFQAYITYGVLGLLILPFFVYANFYFDLWLKNTLINDPALTDTKRFFLFRSMYLYFSTFFPLTLIGSYFGAFSPIYLFAPPLLFNFILLYFISPFKLKKPSK